MPGKRVTFLRVFLRVAGNILQEFYDESDMMQERNTTNVIFSGRLAEAMKLKEMTQKDLAAAASCTQSAISLYLKGRVPSGEILVTLARALGTTAEILCGFEPVPKNSETHEWRRRAEIAEGKVTMLKSGLNGLLKKI
jgi:transcriptional regulator with XRE-family HTH domain